MGPDSTTRIPTQRGRNEIRRREADIALRSFRPTQPDLIATKLRDSDVGIYGNTEYVEQLGHPIPKSDLGSAHFIGFDNTERYAKTLRDFGLDVTRKNFPVLTENHMVQWEYIKCGIGLGMVPTEIGDVEPCVVRVFPDMTMPVPQWLTAHRELSPNRRLRTVFDFMTTELSS